ncbi:hypothetical protein N9034_00380 [bacterium]|nr:hypothetical protein [bacterium]MDB4489618.1 hypothetical protein [bacterium]
MALVNLTTNLKSLRYGKDTVGGGNSNQPYVKTSIPEDLSDVGRTGGPDFLLRGGTLLPKIVVNDVSRMTKMFFDFKSPRGPLFIAKQNLLSLTNVSSQVGYKEFKESNTPPPEGTSIGNLLRSLVPPLNQGIYLPLSTIGQAAGNAIGLHLDKQGLGFNFKTTVGSPDGNSLLGLPTYLNTIHTNATDGPKSRLFGLLDKVNTDTQGVNNLYSYSGGPGAILGVGKTNIVMVGDQRTGINNPNTTREKPKVTWGSATRFSSFANPFDTNNFGSSPLSRANQIGSGGKTSYTIGDINISPTVNDNNLSNAITNDQFLRVGASAAYLGNNFILQNANTSIKNAFLGNGKVQTFSVYEQNDDPFSLSTKNNGKAFNSGILDRTPQLQLSQEQISSKEPFSKTGNQNNITNFTKDIAPNGNQFIPNSLNYINDNKIENRVNLGDPGKRANRISYTIGRQEEGQDLTVSQNSGYKQALDKVNALPIYQSSSPTTDNIKNDLVKFRIGVISNSNPNLKTYIHFRAFIDSMSDNFTAEWQDQAYMGRGEKFYKYQGFDRSINLSWTVAAQSKQELIPMHQKLNYLASVCAPDYSPEGYMGGNLISLTIGGWCYEQVGIMKGLNLEIPTESPWEIALPDEGNKAFAQDGSTILSDASVKELPMIIRVTGFNFIPIHNFVPKVQQNYFPDKNGALLKGGGTFVGEYGKEQYIGLATTGNKNNYSGGKGNINYVPSRVNPVPTSVLKSEGIDFKYRISTFETPNLLI